MRRGVFITGTGTGVGKTVVTRGVVRALSRGGLAVAALKPVESGFCEAGDDGARSDAALLLGASGLGKTLDDVCAYRLSKPVSPHLAAALDGVRIDPSVLAALLLCADKSADLVIAEGAGGLLVPLADDLLYADFIAMTGYGLVIVAPNALGAIHAALATVEVARARDIEVLGVVLNGTSLTELDNVASIERFGRIRILGVFPTVDIADDDTLADAAEAHLDLASFSRFSRQPRSTPGSR
jgi:dethiobiotin synthetase